jgi:16S rRNA (guanine(966)-N(2))-methyltransferase RsmD
MRVTGGSLRGRKLKTTPGLDSRPTTDKVRQAIFNILMHDILDADILDLFAGSGALGIEALSRGANSAVFVEKGRAQVAVIKDNLESLDLKAELINTDFKTACGRLSESGRKFDIIFADPPYADFTPPDIIDAVLQYNLLADSGFLIIEHRAGKKNKDGRMKLIKERKFGQTEVSIYVPGND